MAELRVAPYGSWKSPITADLVVAETIRLRPITPEVAWRYADGVLDHRRGCMICELAFREAFKAGASYSGVREGVPVAYVPVEGEQHGFRRADNIKRALEAELSFCAQVLGFDLADPVEPVAIENL